MTRAYGPGRGGWWQPFADRHVGFVAAALATGVWCHDRVGLVVMVATVGAVAAVIIRPHTVAIGVVVALVAGAGLGARAWASTAPRTLGPYTGWATLVGDPEPVGRGVRAVFEVDGERFQTYAYGSARRSLLARHAGERIHLAGTRAELTGAHPERSRVRHVVGRLDLDHIGDHSTGTPLSRASNRVRGQLRRTAEASMPPEDAALFTGLVVGDDARQSRQMIGMFREAGLSHLTAVSGQNVAFVLAVAGIGLRRLRPGWRLAATLTLVAWFTVLTRLEPSVLRAGMMAGLAAIGFARGEERSTLRLLHVAVVVLVVADPLLVWSVGFWLSVGASFGVIVVGPWLALRLAGPRWLVAPLAVTLGAQTGVAIPSLAVFGRLPVVGIPANLLAVPVAGAVMLYGLPAGVIASFAPAWLAGIVMAPAGIGTRWVATVARLAAAVEPTGWAAAWCWAAQAGAVVALAAMHRRSRRRETPPSVER